MSIIKTTTATSWRIKRMVVVFGRYGFVYLRLIKLRRHFISLAFFLLSLFLMTFEPDYYISHDGIITHNNLLD